MDSLKERTTHGQVQELTTNSITIKSKGGKTATFPITGTEQYYQNGIKAGKWVYIHFKGEMDTPDPENPSHLYGFHTKVFSVSDIDPLKVPEPTPTPAPSKNKDQEKERQMRAVIQGIQTNILQVSVENTDNLLNLNMSAIPCYFSGGLSSGSHVTVTYTGEFDGVSTAGISILALPVKFRNHSATTVSPYRIRRHYRLHLQHTHTSDLRQYVCDLQHRKRLQFLHGRALKWKFRKDHIQSGGIPEFQYCLRDQD